MVSSPALGASTACRCVTLVVSISMMQEAVYVTSVPASPSWNSKVGPRGTWNLHYHEHQYTEIDHNL